MRTIPEDLVDFLEGGVAILVATRDAQSVPELARGVGASISKDRTKLTIFVHEQWGATALANLAQNGEIAVGFSRPLDNFAIQLKGKVSQTVPSERLDRTLVDRYHASYAEQLYMVGVPRSTTKRFRVWPSTAVTFEVRDIFAQTPGPGAGKPFEAG